MDVVSAGSSFVVSPIFKPEIVEYCKNEGVVVIPGCFSPTEIYTAWELGADIVKVFPANIVGIRYFSDILNVFPEIRLLPTGGVTLENAGDWIRAGAFAVAIGTALLDKEAVKEERYEILTEKAQTLVENIRKSKL